MITLYDNEGHGTNYFTVAEVAKVLALKDSKGKPIGRNKFYKKLRDEEILMDNNYPFQHYLNLDLVVMHEVKRGNYTLYIPIFSQRGIDYLRRRYTNEKY